LLVDLTVHMIQFANNVTDFGDNLVLFVLRLEIVWTILRNYVSYFL